MKVCAYRRKAVSQPSNVNHGSLFTLVPVDDVLDFMGSKVNEGSFSPTTPIQKFRKMIKKCAKNNYFEWSTLYTNRCMALLWGVFSLRS